MLTKKKKLSRKEIREDKLVSTYYKAYGYFEENKSRLLLVAGAVAVIIIAIFVYISNRQENNRMAGIHLARVMNLYDIGSFLEAIEGREGTNIIGLKKIAEEYGSTENGEIAKIYLANAYSFLGRSDEAFQYYKDYSGSNKIFRATSFAGQAGYYAMKKDFEKAGDLYLRASRVTDENVLNPEYMLKAGINYLYAGKDDKAKELFNRIKEEHSASTASREVDRYLAQIE
jgi:tetratricopeptide (TPR) repeat protein